MYHAVVPRGGPFGGDNNPFLPFFKTIVLTVEAHLQSKQSFLDGDFKCALHKTRTQLGPSLSLDYRAGFTLSRFYTPS